MFWAKQCTILHLHWSQRICIERGKKQHNISFQNDEFVMSPFRLWVNIGHGCCLMSHSNKGHTRCATHFLFSFSGQSNEWSFHLVTQRGIFYFWVFTALQRLLTFLWQLIRSVEEAWPNQKKVNQIEIVKEISRLPFWWPCRNDNDNFCRMTTWVIEWLAIFCDIHEGDMTEWYWTAFATPCNVSYNKCKGVKSRKNTLRLQNPFLPFPS